MDFLNRTRSTNRRKVQGSLIRNLHLAHQNLAEGAARWSPSGARGQAVQTAVGTAARNTERSLDSVPNVTEYPTKMSTQINWEGRRRPDRTSPALTITGPLRSQIVKEKVEATPESKAMRGDMGWRKEAVTEATNAALEGGVSKGKVRKIVRKYTPKKSRRQR
jgi:hypothetical protein